MNQSKPTVGDPVEEWTPCGRPQVVWLLPWYRRLWFWITGKKWPEYVVTDVDHENRTISITANEEKNERSR